MPLLILLLLLVAIPPHAIAQTCTSIQYRDACNAVPNCFWVAYTRPDGTLNHFACRPGELTVAPSRQTPSIQPPAPQVTQYRPQQNDYTDLILSWTVLLGIAGGLLYLFVIKPRKKLAAIKLASQAALVELQRGRTDPTPPSGDETKRAINHLRLSNAFFKESFEKAKNGSEQIDILQRASHQLLLAAKLDPSVTLTTTDDGKTLTESIDELSAKYCYYESGVKYDTGIKWKKEADEWYNHPQAVELGGAKGMKKRATAKLEEALPGAKMAVRYQPNSVFYLQHLTRVYMALEQFEAAAATLAKAAELDPDNIETLKLQTGYT